MRQRPFRECEHEHEHEYSRAANMSIHRSSAIHTELGAFGMCGAVALLGFSLCVPLRPQSSKTRGPSTVVLYI